MTQKRLMYTFVSLCAFIIISNISQAQLNTSRIFNNGAVLQRNIDIPVWGTSKPNAEIRVRLNTLNETTTANSEGKWQVLLPASQAGGPFEMEITSNEQSITYHDIYIGDVWLASGQSNMEMTVSQSNNGSTEIASAGNELIREFKIPKSLANDPSDQLIAGSVWKAANKSNVGNFSATAYYFAKHIQAEINVPVGIINTSYGGSRIEAWMSDEMLGFDEQDIVLAGGTYPERQPTLAYNKMINPLIQFPIKGFLWYQGESNADNIEDAIEYGNLFKTMINEWRNIWQLGNIPFLWVQLPGYGQTYDSPQAWDAWPKLRNNQSKALALPNTAEAVTIDLGDEDIHPKNKLPVGQRLANLALKNVYNFDIQCYSPRYSGHSLRSDGKIAIAFDNVYDSLKTNNGNAPQGFAIAGQNGIFEWAEAQFDGDSLLVWSNNINNPVKIRYAWEYNPANANIYNSINLPAAPFMFYVNQQDFSIKSFNSTTQTIELGQFAVLTWEVLNAAEVKINGKQTDASGGIRAVPTKDTSYTLEAISAINPNDTLRQSINIAVEEPKPTIAVHTNVGTITAPNTEITIIADANPPKNGSIEKVEFFINGQSIETVTQAPYEINWTSPDSCYDFILSATVSDQKNCTVASAPIILKVTNLRIDVYEAENAQYTGTGSIKSSSKASNGKYVDLQSGWTITFDNIEVPEDGTYPLTIQYLLNYEGPKAQKLIINGKNMGEITFSSPDNSLWMSYFMNAELNKGKNIIQLEASWGWMSFDYISVGVEDNSIPQKINKTEGMNQFKLKNYPNPFKNSTNIEFTNNKPNMISLDIYNYTGLKIDTLVNTFLPAGKYFFRYDTKHLVPGIYFAKLHVGDYVVTNKLLICD